MAVNVKLLQMTSDEVFTPFITSDLKFTPFMTVKFNSVLMTSDVIFTSFIASSVWPYYFEIPNHRS